MPNTKALAVICALGIVTFPVAASSQECSYPASADVLSGSHDDGMYNFEYLSYFWDHPVSFFEFGRCIHNYNERPLWVHWEHLGLEGVARGGGKLSKVFQQTTDDKLTNKSRLHYGAAPVYIEPDAIHRPIEARNSLPVSDRLWLAQNLQYPDLHEALSSSEAFAEGVELLFALTEQTEFQLRSSARIALPVSTDAFEKLKSGEGSDQELNHQFFEFEVTIGQNISMGDNLLLIEPYFSTEVSAEHSVIFVDAEPIEVSVSDDSELIYLMFEDFAGSFTIDSELDSPSSVETELIEFPARAREATIELTFGDYGRIELPIVAVVK